MSRERSQKVLTDCFGKFGPINFPYHQMGKIDSLHLFGLNTELAILSMYIENRHKWKKVLDIGANLGLHSICMAKMGFTVRAYEPDPRHYERLVDNLIANSIPVLDSLWRQFAGNGDMTRLKESGRPSGGESR